MQSLHVDNIYQAIPSELLYLFVSDSLQKKNVHQFVHVNRRRGNVKSYETELFKFNNCIFADRHIPVILHQSVISVLLYLRPKH